MPGHVPGTLGLGQPAGHERMNRLPHSYASHPLKKKKLSLVAAHAAASSPLVSSREPLQSPSSTAMDVAGAGSGHRSRGRYLSFLPSPSDEPPPPTNRVICFLVAAAAARRRDPTRRSRPTGRWPRPSPAPSTSSRSSPPSSRYPATRPGARLGSSRPRHSFNVNPVRPYPCNLG